MEQPCYKCGQTVEQGIPFCPHCAAPQIRVVIAEPAGTATGQPAVAASEASVLPVSHSVPGLVLPMRWSAALRSCALAALIAFLIALLTQIVVLGMLAAGFLAVVFHRQRRTGIPLTVVESAKLGALAGILCSVIVSLFMGFAASVPDVRAKMQDECIASAQKLSAWFPANPAIQEQIDELKTPRGFVMALIKAGIVLFVLSIVLAGAGGALGGAMLGRRDKT